MRLSARRIACVDRCFTQRNEPAASSSRQSRLLRRVVNCGSEFRPQRPYLYLQGSAISGHSLIAKESAEKDAQALPSKVGRCHSWVRDFRSQPRVVLAPTAGVNVTVRCLPLRSSRLPPQDTQAATEAKPFLRKALAPPLRQPAKKEPFPAAIAALRRDALRFAAPPT